MVQDAILKDIRINFINLFQHILSFMMISARLILILFIFLTCFTLGKQQRRKIYFMNDDSLELLNGNVKQMDEAPVDDELMNILPTLVRIIQLSI